MESFLLPVSHGFAPTAVASASRTSNFDLHPPPVDGFHVQARAINIDINAGLVSGLVSAVAGFAFSTRRRKACAKVVAQRPRVALCAQDVDADALNKLQECLKAATEAEAQGDELVDVARAEEQAKEVLLFVKNGFRQFGAATQREKRPYTAQELKDEGLSVEKVLELEDTTVGLRRGFLAAFAFGGGAFILAFKPTVASVFVITVAALVAWGVDMLVSQGLVQGLIIDSLARVVNSEYGNRRVQHEAARFLIAYLLGVLPKAYTLSSFDALTRFQSVNIKSGCVFCQAAFQRELQAGTLSSKTVDKFVCVKLAGIVQEYLMFGRAQSGVSNLEQVEGLFQSLNFEPRRIGDETRWAILTVASLLRKYKDVHAAVAKAIAKGSSVGACIAIIERNMPLDQDSVGDVMVSQAETA